MNCFLLFFVIPLALVAVVLLCGFAGCADIAQLGEADYPPAASNLIAKPAGATRVSLSWNDNSGRTANYVIERTIILPDGSGTLSQIEDDFPGIFFLDKGLQEGTFYLYRVKAVSASGATSDGSNYASATTFRTAEPPTWNTAFEAQLTTISTFLDSTHFDSRCMVQRINAAQLKFGGTKVRITLRGCPQGNLVIDKVSIAPGSSLEQPWNSIDDPLGVLAAGIAGVTLPANTPKTLDITDYSLDPNRDLIVAFDINNTGGDMLKADMPGPAIFSRKNTSEAGQRKRSVGYDTEADTVFLVEKIEVS